MHAAFETCTLILVPLGGSWLPVGGLLLKVCAVGGLRGWRLVQLAVCAVGGWRFARLAVCAVCSLRGWRFARLAFCAVGVLRGWRFVRLAVCVWRFAFGGLAVDGFRLAVDGLHLAVGGCWRLRLAVGGLAV